MQVHRILNIKKRENTESSQENHLILENSIRIHA